MIKLLTLALAACTLVGCKATSYIPNVSVPDGAMTAVSESSACSPMLGWIGGLCLIAGMILLVITRGSMGWRPLIGGVIFIAINWALALYGGWFFLPVAICTGAISLAWTGKIVWKIVNDDEIKIKEMKL
jgi:hypothetical protein